MYVKYGNAPTLADYDFYLEEGVLTINPLQSHYHKKGTYFILVTPNYGFAELF